MISEDKLKSKCHKIKWSAFLAGHFLFLGMISSCGHPKQADTSKLIYGEAMGTEYHIKIVNCADEILLKNQIDSLLLVFNGALSTYDTSSVISLFNRNKVNFQELKSNANEIRQSQLDQFLKVCYRSFDIYAASGGAFDPGAGPLFTAWGFAESNVYKIPTQAFIDSCLLFARYDKLELIDGLPNKKDPRLSVNYNAIAKGYGVDLVADFLDEQGYHNYMVEIGGEVRCKGKNQENQYWLIGINVPDEKASIQDAQAMLEIRNRSMATSGNYRNFFIEKGVKYAHTIDPRTGIPAKNDLLSASILANDCMTADAYATACMVLGKEKCLDLIAKDSTLDAFLLYRDNSSQIKSVFTEKVESLIKQ